MNAGAKGVRVSCAGALTARRCRAPRLITGQGSPADAARGYRLWFFGEPDTYGLIGVKVWLFKGEILGKGIPAQVETAKDA